METTVKIPGMHCNACATLITEVSEENPSVQGVKVDLDSKVVTVEHGADFDFAAWTKEIESLGAEYKVVNQ